MPSLSARCSLPVPCSRAGFAAAPRAQAVESTSRESEGTSFYEELMRAFFSETADDSAPGETSGGTTSNDDECPADTDCFTPDDFYEPPGCPEEPEDDMHSCG